MKTITNTCAAAKVPASLMHAKFTKSMSALLQKAKKEFAFQYLPRTSANMLLFVNTKDVFISELAAKKLDSMQCNYFMWIQHAQIKCWLETLLACTELISGSEKNKIQDHLASLTTNQNKITRAGLSYCCETLDSATEQGMYEVKIVLYVPNEETIPIWWHNTAAREQLLGEVVLQ
jgi:hypothetical protein